MLLYKKKGGRSLLDNDRFLCLMILLTVGLRLINGLEALIVCVQHMPQMHLWTYSQ